MPEPDTSVTAQVQGDSELYNTLVGHLEEGIYMLDREGRIQYWNSGAEKITGYLAHEVVGRRCDHDLLMHRDRTGTILCGAACPLGRVMEDGRPHECTMLLRHRRGHYVPVRSRALAVHGSGGARIGSVEVFEAAAAGGRAEWQALAPHGCLDEMTGAVSRLYGEQKAAQQLADWARFGVPLGWLRIELDDAEKLEHRYGHGMIDAAMKLIASTAERNLACLDVLTRWNPTEFRLAVPNSTHSRIRDLARLLVVLTRCSTLEWWGDPLLLTISVGGGMAESGDSLESLEKRAAESCAASRAAGGDRATLAGHAADPSEGTLLQLLE